MQMTVLLVRRQGRGHRLAVLLLMVLLSLVYLPCAFGTWHTWRNGVLVTVTPEQKRHEVAAHTGQAWSNPFRALAQAVGVAGGGPNKFYRYGTPVNGRVVRNSSFPGWAAVMLSVVQAQHCQTIATTT